MSFLCFTLFLLHSHISDVRALLCVQVDMLVYLATVAKGAAQKVEVLVQVISSLFDINPSMSTHMATPLWKRSAFKPLFSDHVRRKCTKIIR